MKRKYRNTILLFIFFTLIIFSYFNSLYVLDNLLKDKLFQNPGNIDTRIVIVGIDDYSLEQIGRWPWDRDIHAKLLNTLVDANPAAIGMDIVFSDKTDHDTDLADALRDSRIVLPVYAQFPKVSQAGVLKANELNYPADELKEVSEFGHINMITDEDGILRNALLGFRYNEQYIESFAYKLYEKYKKKNSMDPLPVSNIPRDSLDQIYINYSGEPDSFEMLSYSDVLYGNIPAEYFENKIVLIGPYATGLADDYYYTSAAPQLQMYGVEAHANIIQNLLEEDFKINSLYADILSLTIISLISFFSFRKLKMLPSFILMIFTIAVYIFISKYIYSLGIMLQIIYPIISLLSFYVVFIIFRYLEEYLEKLRINSAFERYVAPEIVNEILSERNEKLGLAGIKKEITVMFVDIRGFTTISEKLEPEDVVKILNEYLDICTQSIFEHKGTLDKFIGDAAMAVFNAPVDIEDHELSAVKCALKIRNRINEINGRLKSEYGYDIKPGIGINTGFAVIGNIGSQIRMDYTAIGDAVNTAARLESNAIAGQILISSSTYQKVSEKVNAPFAGRLKVKGKDNEVETYQLEGVVENV